ncbi:MSMEG_0567/Sll0786 family nitrogen starvation N-acetyltransferase [Lichenicoccus sp.]|uniref:MSMEG_0567/Sll0786 family nitrogen starvation N-acetyltransferase n=1 Tax=Lichenicoccus sp. TaxID=2781899 RepID=UPI003D11C7CF
MAPGLTLYEDAILPFVPGEYRVKLACEAWERHGHDRLRRAIFCDEQGIFAGDDRDGIDEVATPIVALSCIAGAADGVVGVVRIHQPEPGLWWGSRLGVHRHFRRIGSIGAELVRLAVCTASARGCERFLAHVQTQNVAFFERLHWHSLDAVMLHGRPHHLMQADLVRYLPHGRETLGFVRPQRRIAA